MITPRIPRQVEVTFGCLIAAFVIGAPIWYEHYHSKHFRNFRAVEPGVLYRSAQLTLPGLKRVINDYRIKTVVCLRRGDRPEDQAEEAYCQSAGIRFVRIPPRPWTADQEGAVPVEKGLAAFREVMADAKNLPVLLHCFAGTHRTGAYVAVFRMEFQGWNNPTALKELRSLGYVTLDEDRDVFEFLSAYQPPGKITAQPTSLRVRGKE